MKKTIFSFIQICLSIFFIYLTFSNINVKSLKIIIENSNLLLLALSPILYFISQIISSERLRNLMNVNGFNLSFFENGKLYVIGMFYNFFIPGGIGGDIYKTYLFKKIYNWEINKTIRIIIKDRLIGLGVLVTLLIFLENGLILNFNYFIKILVTTLIYFFGLSLVKLIFNNNKGYLKTFLFSIIVHFFQFLSISFILFSLGLKSNIIGILFVFVLSSILSVFSFGGIGIREYVFFSAASTLNISVELSTSIGLLFTFSAAISSFPGFYYSLKKLDQSRAF